MAKSCDIKRIKYIFIIIIYRRRGHPLLKIEQSSMFHETIDNDDYDETYILLSLLYMFHDYFVLFIYCLRLFKPFLT